VDRLCCDDFDERALLIANRVREFGETMCMRYLRRDWREVGSVCCSSVADKKDDIIRGPMLQQGFRAGREAHEAIF